MREEQAAQAGWIRDDNAVGRRSDMERRPLVIWYCARPPAIGRAVETAATTAQSPPSRTGAAVPARIRRESLGLDPNPGLHPRLRSCVGAAAGVREGGLRAVVAANSIRPQHPRAELSPSNQPLAQSSEQAHLRRHPQRLEPRDV